MSGYRAIHAGPYVVHGADTICTGSSGENCLNDVLEIFKGKAHSDFGNSSEKPAKSLIRTRNGSFFLIHTYTQAGNNQIHVAKRINFNISNSSNITVGDIKIENINMDLKEQDISLGENQYHIIIHEEEEEIIISISPKLYTKRGTLTVYQSTELEVLESSDLEEVISMYSPTEGPGTNINPTKFTISLEGKKYIVEWSTEDNGTDTPSRIYTIYPQKI